MALSIVFTDRNGVRRVCAWSSRPSSVQQLQRVHAASLRASAFPERESAQNKQETPGKAIPEASTAHSLSPQEARAAGAQSDTTL